MEQTNETTDSAHSFELLLSTATGIFFGLGIAAAMLTLFILLLDHETVSAISTILLGPTHP